MIGDIGYKVIEHRRGDAFLWAIKCKVKAVKDIFNYLKTYLYWRF